jgi:cytochrome P450
MRRVMATPWLSGIIGGEMARDQQKFVDFAISSLARRQAKEVEYEKAREEDVRKDFFHYLLRGRDPETGGAYSDSELAAETVLLISAGADTVSITIAACIFYLVHTPLVLQRLAGEIRAAFTSVEDICYSGPTLSSLPYLRACLDETLRMTPPAPGHLPRKVMPGGATIDGVYYPAGTNVGVSTYAIHHSEESFLEPFSFRPERWIAGSDTGVSEESVTAAQAAFCPFSLGTRGCIGKGLAYMEMTTAVARLLWLYDVRGVEGDRTGEGAPGAGLGRQRQGEYQVQDFFVAERDGPMVEFRAREGEAGREPAAGR